jgi:hypothetical protein
MPRAVVRSLVVLTCLAVAPAARADGPIPMHAGGEIRKMSREACAQKALAILEQEHFAFAEVTADGNVRGWDAKTAVEVHAFALPLPDQVLVMVVAASRDNAEAERIRNVVRAHVLDGPESPKNRQKVGPDGDPPPPPVALAWRMEERSALPLLRFFEQVTCLVLEKQGFGTNVAGKNLVFAGQEGTTVAAFLTPAPRGVAAVFNVVTATATGDTSERLAQDLLRRLVKTVYE